MKKLYSLLALLLLASSAYAQVPARSVPMTCLRDDTPSTVGADGQQVPVKCNERGESLVTLGTRLDLQDKVSASQIGSTPTTGTLQNAATADGNGSNLNTTGMASAVLTVNCSSCSGGTTVNFEGTQDGTNFGPIRAVRMGQASGNADVSTTTATAGITYWQLSVANLSAIRARISAYSAGTVTVTGTTSPVPAVQSAMNVHVLTASDVDIAAFGGSDVVTGTGAGGAGIPRVTISNDSSLAANQSVNVNQIGGVGAYLDPCSREATSIAIIDQTSGEQLATGTASERIYVCSIHIVSATAQNVALVSGTGTVCATSTGAMIGGTTAATGWNLAANGGLVLPNTGKKYAMTDTDADNVCLLQSGAGQVSGTMVYVSAASGL